MHGAFNQIGEMGRSFTLSDGCAVVVFGNPEDAAEAVRGFDGVELCERVMEVTLE